MSAPLSPWAVFMAWMTESFRWRRRWRTRRHGSVPPDRHTSLSLSAFFCPPRPDRSADVGGLLELLVAEDVLVRTEATVSAALGLRPRAGGCTSDGEGTTRSQKGWTVDIMRPPGCRGPRWVWLGLASTALDLRSVGGSSTPSEQEASEAVDVAEESPKPLTGEIGPVCRLDPPPHSSSGGRSPGLLSPVGIWRPGSAAIFEVRPSWNPRRCRSEGTAQPLPLASWLVWCPAAKREWSGGAGGLPCDSGPRPRPCGLRRRHRRRHH